MRRQTAIGSRGAALVVLGLGLLSSGRRVHAQESVAVELTLSGYASAPYAERTVRVGEAGVDVAFRAPVSGPLATFQLLWRRPATGCALDLHDDAAGHAGAFLERATVPDTAGWVAVPVGTTLLAGARYHAIVACPANADARLGFVLDRDPVGMRAGAWALIAPTPLRADATPLFAITYADGRSWGQPYRALPRRAPIRICGANEASETIVSATPLAITAVQVPAAGRSDNIEFSLGAAGGDVVLGGQLVRTARRGRGVYVAELAGPAVSLEAGVPYVLRLRAPTAGDACVRQRPLVTDLPLGRPIQGIDTGKLAVTDDGGQTWQPDGGSLLAVTLLSTPPATCGDGKLQAPEACDGAADDACPGQCTETCTCPPATTTTTSSSTSSSSTTSSSTTSSSTTSSSTTSSSTTSTAEPTSSSTSVTTSSSTSSSADPTSSTSTSSTSSSSTEPPTTEPPTTEPPTTEPTSTSTSTTSFSTSTEPSTSTTSTTSSTVPPTTVPTTDPRRAVYASGYFGLYDANTITPWPQRLGVILGEANAQGPLVANAKKAAVAAGNPEARFVFYFSLTSLDSKCGCFDAAFYNSFASSHPEWFLKDASGARLSTFVYEIGSQRQFAVDIGNPAFVDAWASYALAAMAKHGWDGVWADNVLRGNFYGWSGWPTNPRTGARYSTADYRADMLKALQRIRSRFDDAGKLLIGNHAAAWEADTFADPVVQQQITTMHGVEIEDCVYNFDGNPHPEANWIAQLKYLDFANRNGVLTQCRGGNGTIGSAAKREYILASYLLSKEGVSNVAQLNNVGNWWSQLSSDLGSPLGGFTCLDPANGLATTTNCPSTGKIYSRRWERGVVLVNPTAGTTVTVPLGETLVRNGTAVTSVTLGPRTGAVLVRP